MIKILFGLLISSFAICAMAQDGGGRLPRAKPKKNDAIDKLRSTHKRPEKNPNSNAKKSKAKRPDVCHAYLASPVQDRLHIEGGKVHYMARKVRIAGSNSVYKYMMNVFNLTRQSNAKLDKRLLQGELFTVQGPLNMSFISHENPAIGYTVLSFKGFATGCARGFGVGVSIPFLKNRSAQKKPGRSLKSSEYKVVEASSGRYFADMTKGILETIDPGSFQRRRAFIYMKEDVPLFWDAPKKMLYVWRASESALVKLGSYSSNIVGRLVIKDGEKLLQQRDKFGIIRSNVIKNSIGIAEVNKWSMFGRSRIYSMDIPKKINVMDASYKVDFKKKLLAIFGGSPATKEYISSVYLYNYAKKKLLASLKLQSGELLDAVDLSPDGSILFVFINSRSTGQASTLKAYDLIRKQWLSIKL